MVRQDFVCPDTGFRLGRWVANLRQRAHFLNESQLQDLENLDFVWSRFKVMPWNLKVDLLIKYKKQNGHTLVPKDYVDADSGFHLGWWVDRMRQAKNSMNKARRQDLEDAGFVWNAFDASWENMYILLKQYKEEKNHVCPKITEEYRGKPLGHWVGMQRQLYARRIKSCDQSSSPSSNAGKSTVISDRRISQLEAIGFVWRLRTSGSVDYEHDMNSEVPAAAPLVSQLQNFSPIHETSQYGFENASPTPPSPPPISSRNYYHLHFHQQPQQFFFAGNDGNSLYPSPQGPHGHLHSMSIPLSLLRVEAFNARTA